MNKSKKGGNIWKFLGEHWYLVANIVIVSLIIILTIVFFLEKPKKKNTQQSKNTSNSCQNNTEKYITDVVVSRGKKCPDGYYNVDITGNKNIKLTESDTFTKLCYKQPDTICKGDLIVTKLNINESSCQSSQCKNNGNNTKTCTTCFHKDDDCQSIDLQLPSLECRCKSCGDVPVGYYDIVLDDNKDSGNIIYNNKCAGVIEPSLSKTKYTQMCMSQDEYGTNNTGISGIIYSDKKVDGYTNVDSTNIFFK